MFVSTSRLSLQTGCGLLMRSWRCLALATLVPLRCSNGFVVKSPVSVGLRTRLFPEVVKNYRDNSHVKPESISRRPLPHFRGSLLSRPNARSRRVGRNKAINRRSSELDAEPLVEAIIEEDLSLIGAMEAALDVLGGSTQWVVAGSVGVVLVTEADVKTLVWVVGSLLNGGFAKFLKKAINQVRPDGSRLKDPGMPSSHAMSLFFLGTYLVIGLQEHGLVDCPIPKWPLDVAQTQVLLAVYAFTASLWRVKAGLHTLAQVSVGAVVGASDAALWYWFCKAYFTSEVEAFFGGVDVPVEVVVTVCLATVLTFGSAQRQVSKLFRRSEDAEER